MDNDTKHIRNELDSIWSHLHEAEDALIYLRGLSGRGGAVLRLIHEAMEELEMLDPDEDA